MNQEKEKTQGQQIPEFSDGPTPPTLFFLGTRSLFSRVVLESLLAQGKQVVGIGIPGEAGSDWLELTPPPPVPSLLPMLPSYVAQDIVTLGWAASIPLWSVGAWDEPALARLRATSPDAIVVACWPRRLPECVLALPRWGCLNLHPSLLPAYRGPAPMFWQLRDGLRQSGVTLHRMSAALDEGEILGQSAFALPEGASGESIDGLAAQHGGTLLGRAVDALRAGRATATPQPAGGSYQPWPRESDFVVPPSWSARRAWNFMRGTAEWGIPFTIPLEKRVLTVDLPLAFLPAASLNAPVVERGEQLAVRFSPGVLLVRNEGQLCQKP